MSREQARPRATGYLTDDVTGSRAGGANRGRRCLFVCLLACCTSHHSHSQIVYCSTGSLIGTATFNICAVTNVLTTAGRYFYKSEVLHIRPKFTSLLVSEFGTMKTW